MHAAYSWQLSDLKTSLPAFFATTCLSLLRTVGLFLTAVAGNAPFRPTKIALPAQLAQWAALDYKTHTHAATAHTGHYVRQPDRQYADYNSQHLHFSCSKAAAPSCDSGTMRRMPTCFSAAMIIMNRRPRAKGWSLGHCSMHWFA